MPTIPTPILQFERLDVDMAHREWGCNCGPAALAACLGLDLHEVHRLLPEWPGYTNAILMQQTLETAGFARHPIRIAKALPRHGLVRLQFGGPWHPAPGEIRNEKWALHHTHWIATKRTRELCWVYDVNAAAWLPYDEWAETIPPALVAGDPTRNGLWWPTDRWEVRRSRSFHRKGA